MVEELAPEVLQQLIDSGAELQIVDVRRQPGFQSGHIPGSENVPFERMIASIDSVSWRDRIVFVCPYGVRSRQAGELLLAYEGLAEDAEVYNLAGGLQAWDGPIAVASTE